MTRTLFGFAVLLAVSTWAQIAIGAESDLVAHYSFSEGSGDVLRDVSGHGNDGKIVGAQWVKSPSGNALSFNGTSDAVEFANGAALNIDGDMTIEAWIKPTSFDARNKLILGDTARLAVERNFLFMVDLGMIYFGHGNDVLAEQMVTPVRLGEWQHVAVICEHPTLYCYIDGKEVRRMTMAFPITRTKSVGRSLGGWWAGHFQGEIGNLRLYNRALTEREVVSHCAGGSQKSELTAELVAPALELKKGMLSLGLLAKNFTGSHEVYFTLAQATGRTRTLRAKADLKETRSGSERGIAQAQFELIKLKPGSYQITAVIGDAKQRVVKTASLKYEYAGKPAWFGSKAGITDKVVSSYIPLAVEYQKGRGKKVDSVRTLAWRYDFSNSPFLAQATSTGAVRYPWSDSNAVGFSTLLAGPVSLKVRVDGSEILFGGGSPRLVAASFSKVCVSQSQTRGKVTLSVQSAVEFDDFVKMDWQLTADEPVTIGQLFLEIPMNSDCARFFYDWPEESEGVNCHSGALKDDYENHFKPIIWMGNEERGLSWFAESDRNWYPADPEKAFQVIHRGSEVVLRLNLVQIPVKLGAGQKLDYTFALQATPVRPIQKSAWNYRFAGTIRYGHDYEVLIEKIGGKPALKEYAARGVRTFLAFYWTDVLNYFKPIGREEQLRKLINGCHEHGIKLVPYFGYQISAVAPEYSALAREVITMPENASVMKFPDMEGQPTSIVCLRSIWQDAYVDGIDRLMSAYNIDGVYLDSLCMPFSCINEAHGCGYRTRDGKLKPTYPIFAVRDTFKRIYTIVKSHKADGIVDAHVYDAMNISALAFATTYWTGEQLGGHLPEAVSLDRFRTEMMGYNWGTPADFLHYKVGDYRAACTISLLHDVPTRPELYDRVPLASSLWKLMDEFGRKDAKFLPYWRNNEYVSIQPTGCYASLYTHPANGVLVVVSNLGGHDAELQAKLSLTKLGLTGQIIAADGITHQPIQIKDGILDLKLPSPGWQTIWIKPVTSDFK